MIDSSVKHECPDVLDAFFTKNSFSFFLENGYLYSKWKREKIQGAYPRIYNEFGYLDNYIYKPTMDMILLQNQPRKVTTIEYLVSTYVRKYPE